MSGYAENSFFLAKINGESLKKLRKVDINKKSLAERLNIINKKLNDTEFFDEYIENFFKVGITSNEATSENVDVFKVLESFANYILNCEESKEMDRLNKPVYVFSKDVDKFEKRMSKEKFSTNINGRQINLVDDHNIINFISNKQQRNSRLPKRQTITKSDLNGNEDWNLVLSEYQKILDTIDKKLKEKPDRFWRVLSNNKFLVKQDMIDVKNSMKGVWGYNIKSSNETNSPDMDVFDFTDFDTVFYLVKMPKPDFELNLDMWLTWNDFIETAGKANLTEKEKKIFIMLQNQYTLNEISDETEIKYNTLYRTVIPNICKKIMKVGNKYDACDPTIKEKLEKSYKKRETYKKLAKKLAYENKKKKKERS